MQVRAPSFRDPAGGCIIFGGRVLRFIAPDAVLPFEGFLQTGFAQKFTAEKKLILSRKLAGNEIAALRESPELKSIFAAHKPGAVFEHEKIPFQNFPHEWPPEMLWAAGKLTLELAQAALADGFCLKDATPHNILFRGSEPVFIDALSFERREPHDPVWKPYAQFIRTFILPLLAGRRWNWPPSEIFLARRDGLEPEEIYKLCGALEKFSPQMLSLVSIPTWLSRRANPDDEKIYQPHPLKNAEKARFILEATFQRLGRQLNSLKPAARKNSGWSDYMRTHSYGDPAFAAKEKFVREVLQEFKPARVLDAGANAGYFSELAAQNGASVVAIDLDAACVGSIYHGARKKSRDILPLVVNLARPSPALGWRNGECASFLDRAAGNFDAVLMLALIHHLVVSERIPLAEILRLAYELTNQLLVIEFIEPQDAMFRRLVRGRGALHASLTVENFERACAENFEVVRAFALPGARRRIYCLQKKGA